MEEEEEDSKSSSEYEHMKKVVQTMKNYQDDMINQHIKKQMKVFSNSPLKRKTLFADVGLLEYVDNLVNCVDANQKVLNEILNSAELEIEEDKNTETLSIDHMRLNGCLAQIVREWSTEGQSDRKCFQLVQEELRSHFPEEGHQDVCVLVPGCGLARLPYELALDGFKVVANEQDYFQLATASFIMNHCSRVDNYRIYPWIHDLRNRIDTKAVTTPIPFPDIDPNEGRDMEEGFQFQMISGDFLKIDEENLEHECVDAIVTTFFIDTAPNILEYVDKIYQLLKPEGIWINFGGLNFAYDAFEATEMCIPMSLDVLKKVLQNRQFVFLRDELVQTSYGPQSMRNTQMNCAFFTCQKK